MKVLIPIASGSEEMEVTIICDLFRRAGAEVTLAGLEPVCVCSRGLKIIPDKLLIEVNLNENFDVIILPGGMVGVNNLISSEKLKEIMLSHKSSIIGAICASPLILHEFGLLQSKDVITSHPSVRDSLIKYNYTEDMIAESGKIISSRGAGTAIEFSIRLIEILFGSETSRKIASDIVFLREM